MEERRIGFLARLGGALYLVIIIIGMYGEMFVRDRLVVSGDAMKTVANLQRSRPLWRFHIAAEVFLLICAIVLLVILYELLRPVSRGLALLALAFNVVSIAVEAVGAMSLVEALFPLGDAAYLKAYTPQQLAAMTMLAVRSHAQAFGVSLIFFGCFCIVTGYLIFRSRFLPKTIGVLMQIAGVCYLINSFALIVSPPLANALFPAILVPSFIGESSLCLWLLFRGVRTEEWLTRSAAR